uniref:B-cell CLL/lymphoma 7 protein family member A n=1 Tax=Suricata suricatta TaxID=37032 RepID=A0A673USQ7_SURSU
GRSCGWLPPSTGPSQRGDFRQAPGSLFLAGRVGRLLAGVPSGVLRVGTCPLPWVSVQWGCRRGGGGAWGGRARTPASLSSRGISACGSVPPDADDNSNQSSIADASPIKQENSSNSSPAPEPASAAPGEGTDAKADETQADGKELPGAEDASDEQNSQSSVENSMNSSEKVERQPSGDAGLVAETSAISQVPRSRPQRGSQISREPAGVSGVR